MVAERRLDADPCRTRDAPAGSAPRRGPSWPRWSSRARLVRRYGTDAALVLDVARTVTGWADEALLAPVAAGCPVTTAELVFGVTHEGAADVVRPARPAYPGRPGARRPRRAPCPLPSAPSPWWRARAVVRADRPSSLDYPNSLPRRPMSPPVDSGRHSWQTDRARGSQHEDGDGDDPGAAADRGAAGLRRADRALRARAAGALLPDERVGPRGRGPGAGDVPARLARERRLPGPLAACGPGSTGSPPTSASPTSRAGRAGRCRPASARPTSTPPTRSTPSPRCRGWSRSRTPRSQVEEKDTIRLAFVAALQHLPARQRAVLILRDVLRWSAAEVAEALDTTAVAVNSALQRAHAQLDKQQLTPDGRGHRPHREPAAAARRVRRGVLAQGHRPDRQPAHRRGDVGDAAVHRLVLRQHHDRRADRRRSAPAAATTCR